MARLSSLLVRVVLRRCGPHLFASLTLSSWGANNANPSVHGSEPLKRELVGGEQQGYRSCQIPSQSGHFVWERDLAFNSLAVTHCVPSERNLRRQNKVVGEKKKVSVQWLVMSCVLLTLILMSFAQEQLHSFNIGDIKPSTKHPSGVSVLDSSLLPAPGHLHGPDVALQVRVFLARPCGYHVGACLGVFLSCFRKGFLTQTRQQGVSLFDLQTIRHSNQCPWFSFQN